jgi:hypothetical protein
MVCALAEGIVQFGGSGGGSELYVRRLAKKNRPANRAAKLQHNNRYQKRAVALRKMRRPSAS